MKEATNNPNNFLLYTSGEEAVKVAVLLKDETIWLTINQLAGLLVLIKVEFQDILKIFLKLENYKKKQLLQKLQQFKQKEAEMLVAV